MILFLIFYLFIFKGTKAETHLIKMEGGHGRSVFDLIDHIIKIVMRLPGRREIPGHLHPRLLPLDLPD